jgi:hypothetical protein
MGFKKITASLRETLYDSFYDFAGRTPNESRLFGIGMYALSACAYFEPADSNHLISTMLALTGSGIIGRSFYEYKELIFNPEDYLKDQRLQEVSQQN